MAPGGGLVLFSANFSEGNPITTTCNLYLVDLSTPARTRLQVTNGKTVTGFGFLGASGGSSSLFSFMGTNYSSAVWVSWLVGGISRKSAVISLDAIDGTFAEPDGVCVC